jgi:hypothetical protein
VSWASVSTYAGRLGVLANATVTYVDQTAQGTNLIGAGKKELNEDRSRKKSVYADQVKDLHGHRVFWACERSGV